MITHVKDSTTNKTILPHREYLVANKSIVNLNGDEKSGTSLKDLAQKLVVVLYFLH